MTDYILVIKPLPAEEGGGYLAYFPGLPGCVSDGEDPSDAAANAMDALAVWMEAQRERGIDVPAPGSAREAATRQADGSRHHDDFHAWALDQAAMLRAAATVRPDNLQGIDFEQIAEEVEGLGISERRQVEAGLGVALEHMIRIATLPDAQSVPEWRKEILAGIRSARRAFTPSMVPFFDIHKIWTEAREDALQLLPEDGVEATDVPVTPPLSLEQMLDPETAVMDLIEIFRRGTTRDPERLRPLDGALHDRLKALVGDVHVDLDQPLSPDDQ